MEKIFKSLLFICLSLFIITPLACSKDDDKKEEPKGDTLECSLIELEVQSIFPTEKFFINGIDENLKDKLIVEYWYNNTFTGVSMNVGTDENDKPFLLAPIHPELPLESGEIQLVFKDTEGVHVCNPKSLQILELPKAEGYTNQVALGLQNLLKQRTDFLNIDEATLAGDLANIEAHQVPFALFYNLLHNEEAEFALIPFLNNDKVLTNESLDKASSIDLTNRLLKKYNVLEFINQNIKDFETNSSKNANNKTSINNDSAGCFRVYAEELIDQMKSAANTEYSDPNTITGKYFNDLSSAATVVGLIPQASGAATIVGAVVWAIQKIEEGYSKTRLSHFTQFNVGMSDTDFLEETACPESIIEAKVHAASNEWSIDKTMWEALLQISAFVPVEGKNKLEEFGFGVVSTFTNTQLTNLANLGFWKDGVFIVPAIECGPIDILKYKYIKANLKNFVFEVDSTNTGGIKYYPIATGKDELTLSLRTDVFSGQTISYSQELNVTPIELTWTRPSNPYFIEPGDPVDLELLLKNTISYDIDIRTIPGVVINYGDNYSESANQNFTILTPTDESKYPFTVTAEFIGYECFRSSEYYEPVTAGIVIQANKISVYTDDDTCFQFGNEKDFNVDVSGDKKEVTWSAKDESGQNFSITQEGRFTAPNIEGKYFITATLDSNSEIFDTLEVEVVESCAESCQWNLTGPYPIANKEGIYFITEDVTGGSNVFTSGGLKINLYNDYNPELYTDNGIHNIQIYMYTSFLPEEGETKVTTGTNAESGNENNLIEILGFNLAPEIGSVTAGGPIGEYTVSLTLENGCLKGSITGTLQYYDLNNNPDELVPVRSTLNFGVYDNYLICDN